MRFVQAWSQAMVVRLEVTTGYWLVVTNKRYTYNPVVQIVNLMDVEQAGKLSSDVRSVRREKDDRKATPKVDQHFAVVRDKILVRKLFWNLLIIAYWRLSTWQCQANNMLRARPTHLGQLLGALNA